MIGVVLAALGGAALVWKPGGRAQRRDPYPVYRALRAWDPVHYDKRSRSFVLTRYEDIAEVLADARFSADRASAKLPPRRDPFREAGREFVAALGDTLYRCPAERHGAMRAPLKSLLDARSVDRLRKRVEWVCDRLLEAAAKRRRAEWMRDVALPLPSIVLADLIDVPMDHRKRFRRWSTDLSALLDPVGAEGGLRRAASAHRELGKVLLPLIAERRRQAGGDLLSELLRDSGREWSPEELVALASQLVGMGRETCSNLLGNALVCLGRDPEQRERLREDPALLPLAIEEFLRFESPVQVVERVALVDCEIGESTVAARQLVKLVLGSANRDPAVFDDPDRLDVGRRHNPHLAFGAGGRSCLGDEIARLLADVALGTLLREFPDFSLREEPRGWITSHTLRGPVEVPIRFES